MVGGVGLGWNMGGWGWVNLSVKWTLVRTDGRRGRRLIWGKTAKRYHTQTKRKKERKKERHAYFSLSLSIFVPPSLFLFLLSLSLSSSSSPLLFGGSVPTARSYGDGYGYGCGYGQGRFCLHLGAILAPPSSIVHLPHPPPSSDPPISRFQNPYPPSLSTYKYVPAALFRNLSPHPPCTQTSASVPVSGILRLLPTHRQVHPCPLPESFAPLPTHRQNADKCGHACCQNPLPPPPYTNKYGERPSPPPLCTQTRRRMDLASIKDAFDRVPKKQRVSDTKAKEAIDGVIGEISLAIDRLTSASGQPLESITGDLHKKLLELAPSNSIAAAQKDTNLVLSKYGKSLEKLFSADIAKAYREVEPDPQAMNQIIALHFYRQGLFELGDCFAGEARIPSADALKAPFYEMYQVLEHLKAKDLGPALAWANLHRQELLEKGSCLEFKLHQFHFLQLLQKGSRNEALAYARESFVPFAQQHMGEIQRLMGCLIFTKKLEISPYSDLFVPLYTETVTSEFIKECCGLMGQSHRSPLHTALSAGAQALPTLLKMATVWGNKKQQDWQSIKQLPVEIELDREFQYHSIFACPVSKDQSSAENPPMLMPCGHVLCKQSLQKLSKSRTFKCPYCPAESSLSQCKQIFF